MQPAGLDGFWAFWSALPQHTQLFLLFIVAGTLYLHVRFSPKTVANGPTILTTTGIFATFLGIAMGLAEFDVANVQASVPALLDGLKTAFWASVVGVGGALTLKIRDHAFGVRAPVGAAKSPDEVTAGDLALHLSNIHRALVGGEEGSLISQVKLSRQDTNDRLDALKAAQTEALAKLSEMGSKALVEALRDVIRDFNQKISEQFGDNFKALNAAVGQLLVWQHQYWLHVEATVQKLDEVGRITAKTTADYSQVVERSAAFAKVAEDMKALLEGLNTEKQQLISVSGELAKLLQTAAGSLPSVEKKMIELSTQLAASISEHQRIVGDTLAGNSAALRKTVDTVTEQLAQLGNKTKDQVATLEEALATALQQSLSSLGQQLTALSEAFVEDYTPLTQKLRQIVQMAS